MDLKKSLEEVRRQSLIAGFSNVKISNPDAFLREVKLKVKGVKFQLFDADKISGRKHLEFAALNALWAFRNGYNYSKSLPVEVLLFASTQRQIKKAIELLGVTSRTVNLALIIVSGNRGNFDAAVKMIEEISKGKRDDSIIEVNSKAKIRNLMKIYGISSKELRALKAGAIKEEAVLTNLIIEKMALLTVQR
jgi:KEOPS complex subunit Cgi121